MNAAFKDKKYLEDIERRFDATGILMIELSEELKDLAVKFGPTSNLVQRRKDQLATISQLYDSTREYIDFLRGLNIDLMGEATAWVLMNAARDSGLPISKVVELCGGDPTRWSEVDKLDQLISDAQAAIRSAGVLPEAQTPLEFAIQVFKDRD